MNEQTLQKHYLIAKIALLLNLIYWAVIVISFKFPTFLNTFFENGILFFMIGFYPIIWIISLIGMFKSYQCFSYKGAMIIAIISTLIFLLSTIPMLNLIYGYMVLDNMSG